MEIFPGGFIRLTNSQDSKLFQPHLALVAMGHTQMQMKLYATTRKASAGSSTFFTALLCRRSDFRRRTDCASS